MKQKHNVTVEGLGIEISTGTLAGLASGAVTISMGETELFVSVTAASSLRPGQDFFPLTVGSTTGKLLVAHDLEVVEQRERDVARRRRARRPRVVPPRRARASRRARARRHPRRRRPRVRAFARSRVLASSLKILHYDCVNIRVE